MPILCWEGPARKGSTLGDPTPAGWVSIDKASSSRIELYLEIVVVTVDSTVEKGRVGHTLTTARNLKALVWLKT